MGTPRHISSCASWRQLLKPSAQANKSAAVRLNIEEALERVLSSGLDFPRKSGQRSFFKVCNYR